MIDVIITSFKEPKATLRAVEKVLSQKVKGLRVIVCDPFPETEKFIKKNLKGGHKSVIFFTDPGEGKSYALNLLFNEFGSKSKEDIFILTDGDVFVGENAVQSIKDAFNDPNVGCVTGKPVCVEDRSTKYGYWANFLFDGIDSARRKLSDSGSFLECSGYLFAIRKGVISDFPLETSEDSIIPYLFWNKGYKIRYVPQAQVYVKNPSDWKDWLTQKVRNIKGHENLSKIAPNIPRTKSFFNEIKHGWHFLFFYPKNIKEFFWTVELYFARLFIYYRAFKELKQKKSYADGWRETETPTTKPLD
ncbi:MAG: glycosyltransferase family 2 protein [Nanoarchaeota archaeon]